MANLEVFIPCDRCGVRSRDVWIKGQLLLTLCGHHADRHHAALHAQGFNPMNETVPA